MEVKIVVHKCARFIGAAKLTALSTTIIRPTLIKICIIVVHIIVRRLIIANCRHRFHRINLVHFLISDALANFQLFIPFVYHRQ